MSKNTIGLIQRDNLWVKFNSVYYLKSFVKVLVSPFCRHVYIGAALFKTCFWLGVKVYTPCTPNCCTRTLDLRKCRLRTLFWITKRALDIDELWSVICFPTVKTSVHFQFRWFFKENKVIWGRFQGRVSRKWNLKIEHAANTFVNTFEKLQVWFFVRNS